MVQTKVKIVSNIEVATDHYKMALKTSAIARFIEPGQFIHVRVSDRYNPLLRRPFSVHRISRDSIEILYKVVGKGTRILAEKAEGEELDILGPLGNGFRLALAKDRRVILIGGGIGVAPLLCLAERLVSRFRSHASGQRLKSKIKILIGARTKEVILCKKEFKNLGIGVEIATDDGSKGYKGFVTELLENELSTINYQLSTVIYACGPRPMLKKMAQLCKPRHIPCQISLEENMGCGLGACLGCVVKTKDGYKRVCKDGPIFGANQVIWK